jgi:proliferating cell nuclear antigen
MTLGVSISNLAKVMRLAGNDDIITLRAEDDPSYLSIIFENRKQEKKTEFNLNLITLDSEHLGIPETSYTSEIMMNSIEFSKLVKELHALSETVTVETTVDYVRFTIDGEVGSGSVQI